jgi:phosphoribosyl-dephospho-CoA transferase
MEFILAKREILQEEKEIITIEEIFSQIENKGEVFLYLSIENKEKQIKELIEILEEEYPHKRIYLQDVKYGSLEKESIYGIHIL